MHISRPFFAWIFFAPPSRRPHPTTMPERGEEVKSPGDNIWTHALLILFISRATKPAYVLNVKENEGGKKGLLSPYHPSKKTHSLHCGIVTAAWRPDLARKSVFFFTPTSSFSLGDAAPSSGAKIRLLCWREKKGSFIMEKRDFLDFCGILLLLDSSGYTFV